MQTVEDHAALERLLHSLDGQGYGAYRRLEGRWGFPDFELVVDHVQRDPFAPLTRVRARVAAQVAALPEESYRSGARRIGTSYLLARRFAALAEGSRTRQGSGRSGEIRIEAPGQEVLANTALQVGSGGALEARFGVGLPARGRRILGAEATRLLVEALPRIVAGSLRAAAYEPEEIRLHAEVNEDADELRRALPERGLVAFVADGALLPRRSGVDDRPLEGGRVVPFRSPPSLRVTLPVPNSGRVTGMGIPRGVTLIVGGGFHGKSTLLRAVERGVYNHPPGDGRERVASDPGAVKVRAEDRRSVVGVDISPFVQDLPGGEDTVRFSSPDASGSTSQAAAIMEALEAGASALLIDEDTAATNLMIRDRRMQALVPKEREPITPFIDRVRELYDSRGVSALIVLGGSGDYLDVADTVVAMSAYLPEDRTGPAREVAGAHPTGRIPEAPAPMRPSPPRVPDPESVDPSHGRRRVRVQVREVDEIRFGAGSIDLSAVAQLVSPAQTRAVAEALVLARHRFVDGRNAVPEILDAVMEAVEEGGLDVLGHGDAGDLALFRRFELGAALNRLRTLRIGTHLPTAPAPRE